MLFIPRGIAAVKQLGPAVSRELCKVPNNVAKIQVATLTRAAFRDPDDIPIIPPYPYHKKPYHFVNQFLDTSKCRLHEHSKVIVIDGPPAIGKHKLAKQLAEEFDFLYLPQPTFAELYMSEWGYDYRQINDKVPEDCQWLDMETFLKKPNGRNTCAIQNYMYYLRINKYMEALRHIFCTGQGVVTVRSPWSDIVFTRTLNQNGYLSAVGYNAYQDSLEASIHWFLKPHLVVYLDASVKTIQDNIKKRGRPAEVNSTVFSDKYLADLEENYKSLYLDDISKVSHLLVYDWTHGGDVEIVVEDIENLNFERKDSNDPKFEEWDMMAFQWKCFIKHYTYNSVFILRSNELARFDVDEMLISGNDFETWYDEMSKLPDLFYTKGFNPYEGDNYMFKYWDAHLFPDHVTPLIEKYNREHPSFWRKLLGSSKSAARK